jgi:hypothetical protein
MLKYACASIALLALSNPALAASGCANPTEAAALKTAVLQQELMVAALQCRESGAYNRFVNTYRPELQTSDASLKAFFVRRGGEHGEAGYDAFKTKAANLSALENARDARAFCADAHALFEAAMSHRGSLMSFVNTRAGAADVGNVCIDSRPGPVLAAAETKAPAPAKPVPITAPVAAAIKAAAAPVQVAVGGVPTYNVPAIPYRSEGAPLPPAAQPEPAPAILARAEPVPAPMERAEPRQDYAEQDAILRDREAARQEQLEEDAAAPYEASRDSDEAAPPPRPRYYRARARRYADPDAYAYVPPRPYPPAYQYQYRYPMPPSRYWYRRDYW